MTRRDYILIANVLRAWRALPSLPQIVEDFAIALQHENARFDANKFRQNVWRDKQ